MLPCIFCGLLQVPGGRQPTEPCNFLPFLVSACCLFHFWCLRSSSGREPGSSLVRLPWISCSVLAGGWTSQVPSNPASGSQWPQFPPAPPEEGPQQGIVLAHSHCGAQPCPLLLEALVLAQVSVLRVPVPCIQCLLGSSTSRP